MTYPEFKPLSQPPTPREVEIFCFAKTLLVPGYLLVTGFFVKVPVFASLDLRAVRVSRRGVEQGAGCSGQCGRRAGVAQVGIDGGKVL